MADNQEVNLIDPISGSTESAFLFPEKVLQSESRKQGELRALLDIRNINNPEEDLNSLHSRTRKDVESGMAEEYMQYELNQVAAKQQEQMFNSLISSMDGTEQNIISVADSVSQLSNIQDMYSDVDGYFQASIDGSIPAGVERTKAERSAVQAYAFNKLATYAEKDGALDTVVNYASLLAPDFIKDIADVMEDGPWDGAVGFRDFVSTFRTLDPNDQLVLADRMVDDLYKAFDGNSVKTAGTLALIFDKDDIGPSLGFGAFFDALSVGDVYAVYKAGKAVSQMRSLARRKVDNESIEEAAQLQAAAGQGNKATEAAIGVTKPDSAHSLNPHSTSTIDEGASIDAIAGEMDTVINRQNRIVPEEMLPPYKSTLGTDEFKATIRQAYEEELATIKAELTATAGNKMSRGDVKNLVSELSKAESKLAKLRKEKEGLVTSSKGNAKVQQAAKENRVLLNEDIARLEDQVKSIKTRLNSTEGPVKAEGELSRLQQGKYSEDVSTRLTQAQTRAIDKLAEAKRAVKTAAEAETSAISRGDIPEHFTETLATKIQEERAAIEAERAILKETPKPAQEASTFGYTLPVAELTAKATRAVRSAIIRPEALTSEDIARASLRVVDKLKADLNAAGKQLNSIDLVERTDKGFKVKYRTTSGEGEHTFSITKDDVGATLSENEAKDFKQAWQNHFGSIFSKDFLMEGFAPDLVGDATFAGQQVSKIRNQLADIWKDTEKGLSREENFQVNSILQVGDEEKIETFSIAELRSGSIESAAGKFKFNNRQIESYYQKRAYYRELHDLRSTMIRERLEFEGYENLSYVRDGVAAELIGRRRKNFDVSDIGEEEMILFPNENKYNKGSYVSVNKEKYKDLGFEVIELLEPFYTKDGKKIRLAMAKQDSKWSRLPEKVLNYQPGYIPRIYRNGYYFARNMDSGAHEVLYAFDSKKYADQWADEYKKTTGKNVSVYRDGEFTKAERLIEDANSYGGLYIGARKDTPLMLKTPTGEQRLERMSVAQATERYINNISKIIPYNEYRMVAMERWKNDVHNFAQSKGRVGLGKSQRFDTPAESIDLAPEHKDILLQQRQYIMDTMGTKPRSETLTENMMLGIANLTEGRKFLSGIRNWSLDKSQGDPTAWIKGHSHNIMLGWFNLRQVFVQASNAALAMSLRPQYAVQSIGDALSLRSVALLPEDKSIIAAKELGFSDDTIQSLLEYNKSGLRDSITRHADFDVHELGIGSVGLDTVRKVSRAGKIPFNEGENFSRLVSWSIARREWKDKNKGKAITDKDIVDISKEALRLQLNMQTENAAAWQKVPVVGLATQFLQVQAKFLEAVWPKMMGGSSKWSGQEKFNAFVGQLVLYGAIGVPIVEETVSHIAALRGEDPNTFIQNNPEAVKIINEGFVGIVSGMFGAENVVPSTSMSLLAGIDDNIVWSTIKGINSFLNGGYDEEGFLTTIAGPSVTLAKRTWNVVDGIGNTAKTIVAVPTLDVAYQAILSNMDDVASMTSTWSNAKKAYYLNKMDKLFSTTGKLVATSKDLGQMSLTDQLAIAMGFQTRQEVVLYSSKEALKGASQYKNDTKKEYQAMLRDYLATGNKELFDARKAVLFSAYDNKLEVVNIIDDVLDDMATGKSEVDKTARQNLLQMMKNNGEATTAQTILVNEVGNK